ncbi:MAG TPA: alpha-galactosidase, partial [Acidimicrobiales bacterium]
YVHAGELLWPGELVLPPGGSYKTPPVLGVHGVGLLEASRAFHRHLRDRPQHPRSPRKVLVNTWEAVYFDHDRATLFRLAEAAARVGAERFVLDDGWFVGRRHDRAGLGDWEVDETVHPGGLAPLIDHVHSLGMDFGLWVEPEMVSPDSDLYRTHPGWVLHDDRYPPVLARQQLVLDLARDEVRTHLLARLDALLSENDIAYLKWDMNRDLVQGTHEGRAGTHAQTTAVYALLDELRTRHPGVEIESCASGGGRIDLGILARADRVWASDCNDALERQRIQRGMSLLVPPELMGSHIGPRRAHTTGRQHPLAFRAATAMFGHLGIEWSLLEASDAELEGLAALVTLHKQLRPLLHAGDVLRVDTPEPALLVHGVASPERDEAVVAAVALDTFAAAVPPALRIPGLAPERPYAVAHLSLAREALGLQRQLPAWLPTGVTLTGRQLAAHGVALPVLSPASAILVRVTASD